jgi:hypothetical protein
LVEALIITIFAPQFRKRKKLAFSLIGSLTHLYPRAVWLFEPMIFNLLARLKAIIGTRM